MPSQKLKQSHYRVNMSLLIKSRCYYYSVNLKVLSTKQTLWLRVLTMNSPDKVFLFDVNTEYSRTTPHLSSSTEINLFKIVGYPQQGFLCVILCIFGSGHPPQMELHVCSMGVCNIY